MKTVALTLIALSLCACAQRPWIADDKAQFRRDNYECSRDSVTYGGGTGLVGIMFILAAKSQAQKMYDMCMTSKGYRQASE